MATLFPVLGYWKRSSYKHSCTNLCKSIFFHFFLINAQWNNWAWDNCMLHLVRNCKTICESGIFYMPISSLWEFQFIQMFATPDIVSRFKYSNMYESIFVISFFISLMTNNAENCVHVLVCHLCIFFWRSTVQIDCQIFQWVVCGFII